MDPPPEVIFLFVGVSRPGDLEYLVFESPAGHPNLVSCKVQLFGQVSSEKLLRARIGLPEFKLIKRLIFPFIGRKSPLLLHRGYISSVT